MARTILFPITFHHVDEAIAAAPEVARQAHTQGANVLVLQTECLHGLLTDVDEDCTEMESRRIQEATERVAEALRQQGATVETMWECVRVPRRPVDVETVRRLGADAVFVMHHGGLAGLFEAVALRRLRHAGIAVLHPETAPVAAGARERPPGWDD